jgi:hypothetical protein|nr:MAG TPA: hypothetical protein [Caudoviricetes sp.]
MPFITYKGIKMQANEDWKNDVIYETFKQLGREILCAYHPKSNLKVFTQIERSQHNARVRCIELLSKQLDNLPCDFKAPEVKPIVVTTLEFK